VASGLSFGIEMNALVAPPFRYVSYKYDGCVALSFPAGWKH
jgi:hypothetical protein